MTFSKEKFQKLQRQIVAACAAVGRNPKEIRILAATKYADSDDMNRAIEAGIQRIGENRVQDAKKKFGELLPVEKFFIGHLQSNKVKDAIKFFDGIESIDRLRLAEEVDREAEKQKKVIPVLLEINIAQDSKKFGFLTDEIFAILPRMKKFQHLKIRGFMTIVPFVDNPEKARPFFKKMKQLFELFRKDFPDFDTLSMGMSNDFIVAIEEGATEIRIGSYLFDLL